VLRPSGHLFLAPCRHNQRRKTGIMKDMKYGTSNAARTQDQSGTALRRQGLYAALNADNIGVVTV
jgi:hypothetical protein